MSQVAYAPRPVERPEPRAPLSLAPAPAPRRRLRAAHLVVALGGIAAILLGQLVVSIAAADGAYRISALKTQQRDLAREQRALSEQLQALDSPQNLARNAAALGMVPSDSLPYIDVSTGAITGADGTPVGGVGDTGQPIGNVLLDGVPLVVQTEDGSAEAEAGNPPDPGASADAGGLIPVGSTTDDAATAPGMLPSPTTR